MRKEEDIRFVLNVLEKLRKDKSTSYFEMASKIEDILNWVLEYPSQFQNVFIGMNENDKEKIKWVN